MVDSFKTFFFTFILAPSLLGAGFVITFEVLPFLWSLITFNAVGLAFKNLGISFLLGYVMYLVYIMYKAAVYKLSKNKSN